MEAQQSHGFGGETQPVRGDPGGEGQNRSPDVLPLLWPPVVPSLGWSQQSPIPWSRRRCLVRVRCGQGLSSSPLSSRLWLCRRMARVPRAGHCVPIQPCPLPAARYVWLKTVSPSLFPSQYSGACACYVSHGGMRTTWEHQGTSFGNYTLLYMWRVLWLPLPLSEGREFSLGPV